MHTLTPANHYVPPEVLPLGEEGDGQQSMQIEALNKQPEVTCHDPIVEDDHHSFTAHLC